MLVLTRRAGESIVIGDDVRVVVLDVRGDTVRLGIEAPRSIQVHRAEVYAEVQAANAAAAAPDADLSDIAERLRRMTRPAVPRPAAPGRRSGERRERPRDGERHRDGDQPAAERSARRASAAGVEPGVSPAHPLSESPDPQGPPVPRPGPPSESPDPQAPPVPRPGPPKPGPPKPGPPPRPIPRPGPPSTSTTTSSNASTREHT
jgi:carbon storage regulator